MTVGYGDIAAYNTGERAFCILLMLLGVVSFSYTTGSLASMISSSDHKEAALKEKMSTLYDIQQEFGLDGEFYNELSKHLQYDHRKKSKDLITFMEHLPHKLRLELAMVLHRKLYSHISFFIGKDKSFIAWMTTLLRPFNIEDGKKIYMEGERVTESKLISADLQKSTS